jgi:hypothetical protein
MNESPYIEHLTEYNFVGAFVTINGMKWFQQGGYCALLSCGPGRERSVTSGFERTVGHKRVTQKPTIKFN